MVALLIEYAFAKIFSVFLKKMFDLPGKELKYRKELLLNHYKKSLQRSIRLQDMGE